MYEKIGETMTDYNDTLIGRCAICLESFLGEGEKVEEQKFTDRSDLVRIDHCFHRFHLLCMTRDWFMKRKVEKDQYGCDVEYKMSEVKKCPICRREAT